MFRTFDTCQRPPLAAWIPRTFKAEASPRRSVTPLARSDSTIGSTLAAGLDDKMWWAHQRGDYDGRATFFGALSRAKQRAIFTFCKARGSRDGVSDLYGLLAAVGETYVDTPNLSVAWVRRDDTAKRAL